MLTKKQIFWDYVRGIGIPISLLASVLMLKDCAEKKIARDLYKRNDYNSVSAPETITGPEEPSSATYESLEWRLKHDSIKLMDELEAKKPKDLRTNDHDFLNNAKYNSRGRYE